MCMYMLFYLHKIKYIFYFCLFDLFLHKKNFVNKSTFFEGLVLKFSSFLPHKFLSHFVSSNTSYFLHSYAGPKGISLFYSGECSFLLLCLQISGSEGKKSVALFEIAGTNMR